MSAVIALAPEFRNHPLSLGDLVRLEVMVDGRHGGAANEAWKVVSPHGEAWISAGAFTVATSPVTVLPAEGDVTKLGLTAIVHQAGNLSAGPLSLEAPGGEKVEVPAAQLDVQVQAPPPAQQTGQEDKPTWLLQAVGFGGWNLLLIAILVALLLGILGSLGAWAWQRWGRKRAVKLDHREEALATLQDLQRYSRLKEGIGQNEWKKFSFALAGALRRYSDRNFHVPAFDRTDREFLEALRGNEIAAPHVETLHRILETIDAVRYGRQELNVSVVGELLQDSRRYIKDSFVAPAEEKKA